MTYAYLLYSLQVLLSEELDVYKRVCYIVTVPVIDNGNGNNIL